MPNRILRESIWTSESLNAVSLLAELLFLKLLPYADDFGRFDARLPVMMGRLTPLRPVKPDTFEGWLKELEAGGMIRLYTVRGVRYGVVLSWEKHNEKRAKDSRWPAPEDADPPSSVQANASTCEQMPADANKCASIRDTRSEKREGVRAHANTGRKGAREVFVPPSEPEWLSYCRETWPAWPAPDALSALGWYEGHGWRGIVDWKGAAKTCAHRYLGKNGNGKDTSQGPKVSVVHRRPDEVQA